MSISYSGGSTPIFGSITDNSLVVVNPQTSGWLCSISAGSPTFSAPVNFAPIAGGWGPPGYLIPQFETAPSKME
jgi:hypothetical protein